MRWWSLPALSPLPWSPRDRRQAAAALRERLAGEASPRRASAAERRLAEELRARREAMAARQGAVSACARCAEGRPEGGPGFPGGRCCGGQTELLFDAVELAALKAAGTARRHLRPRHHAHAGCLYRGPRGCTLPPAHRPNRCLWYLCQALQAELAERGILAPLVQASEELAARFESYRVLRQDRLEAEFCADLERNLRRGP